MKSSNRLRRLVAVALAIVAGFAAPSAFAQGTQTATLSGIASSQDGQPLPGVTVTISSPSLQGERTAITDANGGYIFRGLPNGRYKVAFTLSGFATIERQQNLVLGDAISVNATMSVQSVEETVTVTADAPSVLNTTTVGANYKGEQIDKLAMNRNLAAIAEFAPGLTDNTPNVGQVTIAGAFAFDNVFLLNGVDINDNLFGTANNLFIEDAIEETQVLTSGISAEFGRFSGGVINAVTKRGGNTFTGSLRLDGTNPKWTDETPRQKELGQQQADKFNKVWQATIGGPIVKDKLWFFAAGRKQNATTTQTLAVTGIQFDQVVDNPRYEVKLTGSINPNHTITASYADNETEQTLASFGFSIDPRVVGTRQLPNTLMVANYNGVLSPSLFFEAQYSEKTFGFRNTGGTSLNIVDSPFLARGFAGIPANSHYNARYFDSTDPEDRNNRQITAALSYFLSTPSFGRHDIKVGAERFTSTRTGGNSQTSTGWVFLVDPLLSGGNVSTDAQGRIIPNFVPNQSRIQQWLPLRGATIDINTLSLYVNDRWNLNDRWSFNLGFRYEQVKSEATNVQAGADTSALVPRLGATWDVNGDGKHKLFATYAVYAGRAAETQFAGNTNVGNPSSLTWEYTGPAGSGMDFAAGFNPANYSRLINGNFPTANVIFADDLQTPRTREWTLQYGVRLGSKGEVKAIFTDRKASDFLENFTDDPTAAGKTLVTYEGRTIGNLDNVYIRNLDGGKREYQGIQLQANYRLTDRWNLAGHYTHQLKNDGTIEGEAANQPGVYSAVLGNYPEILAQERGNPDGRLNDFQAHKVRLWTNYDLDLGRAGNVSLGATYRWNSPLTFSYTATVATSAIQRGRNPGYGQVPTSQALFFGERGAGEFEASHLFDLALNYEIPVVGKVRPYFKAELRNAFNSTPLIGFDTTILPITTSALDADGLPTTFNRGPNFGKGLTNAHFPIPRTFQFSAGFRF
jgi:hypothetical protein